MDLRSHNFFVFVGQISDTHPPLFPVEDCNDWNSWQGICHLVVVKASASSCKPTQPERIFWTSFIIVLVCRQSTRQLILPAKTLQLRSRNVTAQNIWWKKTTKRKSQILHSHWQLPTNIWCIEIEFCVYANPKEDAHSNSLRAAASLSWFSIVSALKCEVVFVSLGFQGWVVMYSAGDVGWEAAQCLLFSQDRRTIFSILLLLRAN